MSEANGSLIMKYNKVPLTGVEPVSQTPQACILSIELQGQVYNFIIEPYGKRFQRFCIFAEEAGLEELPEGTASSLRSSRFGGAGSPPASLHIQKIKTLTAFPSFV